MSTPPGPPSEREQTDESLRAERARADRALEEDIDALDEAADAVVARARARADAVLAAARAKADHSDVRQQRPDVLKRARATEDTMLQDERASADQILGDERANHMALLSPERAETDRDLSHERSRSDRALAVREEFMGIVSHDLQNILNAMVGTAALLEREAAQDNRAAQVITGARRLQRAGGRMRRLVGDLVDVASIEAGTLAVTREVGDPTLVVTEAVETFQAQAVGNGVTLELDAVAPLPRVAFDSARILQVLSNLLSNAIKFTPSPGTVVVHVDPVGDDIRFAVSDTGTGIPVDKLEAVFERFVQLTKHDRRGVGLGLYISKCIVHGHGGRIWAENRRGGGSTVCFTLPVDTGR